MNKVEVSNLFISQRSFYFGSNNDFLFTVYGFNKKSVTFRFVDFQGKMKKTWEELEPITYTLSNLTENES